jgi:polar amino acid transport system substrate-binding protein
MSKAISMKIFCAAAIFVMTATAGANAQSAAAEAVKELAPSGKLRAAINTGNVVLVQKDESGQVHGVTVDLANELARRLGVPIDMHVYDAAGKVTDAAKNGEWDVGFVAIEPARAQGLAFTAPYLTIEGTYLVATDSPLKNIADVDHDGVRIGVGRGSAYDLYLTRTLQHATLVRYPTSPQAMQGFLTDKLDAAAGVKQALITFAAANPNLKVMDGHFQDIRQAMATPLGRDAGLAYLKSFIEEMKASGFVKAALERAGQPSDIVAPPAN